MDALNPRRLEKLSDAELVRLLVAGRQEVMEVIFDRYYRLVMSVALRIVRDKAAEFARIPGREIASVVWRSPNAVINVDGGKSAIVMTHDGEGKQDGFYRIDLITARGTKLLERGECYTCKWPVSENRGPYLAVISSNGETIVYVAEDAERPPDLWASDAEFQHPRQLTMLNLQFSRYRMGLAKMVEWWSDDGERLHGALLLPAGYEPASSRDMLRPLDYSSAS